MVTIRLTKPLKSQINIGILTGNPRFVLCLNNVIVMESKSERDIAFNKKVSGFVADSEIQNTYLLSSPNLMEKFKRLLESLSADYL